MKSNVWKPCTDLHWQDKLWLWIWRFFGQYAFENNHLLCYWATIHNLTAKIFPILSSSNHFSRLMSCSMSIVPKLCKVKIFQSQSMSTANFGKGLLSRILVYLVWLNQDHSTAAILWSLLNNVTIVVIIWLVAGAYCNLQKIFFLQDCYDLC